MKKKLLLGLTAIILGLSVLSGCGTSDKGAETAKVTESTPVETSSAAPEASAVPEKATIKFGTCPGPYGDMIKLAIKPSLEAKGYTVEIIEFSDYVQPNLALANGEVDANMFQHNVYFENFKTEHNLALKAVINIPTAALGLYSEKYTDLESIPEGSTFTIPNDVTNLRRALKVAQAAGLLTIDETVDATNFSEKNVVENPSNFKITSVEAAQLPRTLQSIDFAAIPGNYALAAQIDLNTALYTETLTEEMKNLIAVKESDIDSQFVQDIKAIVESEDFKNVIESSEHNFSGFQKPDWYSAKWLK